MGPRDKTDFSFHWYYCLHVYVSATKMEPELIFSIYMQLSMLSSSGDSFFLFHTICRSPTFSDNNNYDENLSHLEFRVLSS